MLIQAERYFCCNVKCTPICFLQNFLEAGSQLLALNTEDILNWISLIRKAQLIDRNQRDTFNIISKN